MQKVFRLGKLLLTNPDIFIKKTYATLKKTPVKGKINGVVFEYDFPFDTAIKMMYSGTYEPETIRTIKRILQKGDTFVDVGANIGYISATALSLVGQTGQVHSFEPVPAYFQRLKKVADFNKDYRMTANNFALGESDGQAEICVTNLKNIGWNTLVKNFMPADTVKEKVPVAVKRLDDYIKEKNLTNIALMKIDTEGYEFPVLKGLSRYFESATRKPAIICEVCPGALSLQGYTLEQVESYMTQYGYQAYDISGRNKIDIKSFGDTTDVIFVHNM